jgi:hypothetical protein
VKNYTTKRISSQPIASFPNFQNSNPESYEKSPALALDHPFCLCAATGTANGRENHARSEMDWRSAI